MAVSLLILDLSPNITEIDLSPVFNAAGPTKHIFILCNNKTQKSLGRAIVTFHCVQDAERAFDTLNFSVSSKYFYCSTPIRMLWSKHYHQTKQYDFTQTNNIFILNLHHSIDDKTLYDTFSVFGCIAACKIFDNEKKGTKFAFVSYTEPTSGTKAAEAVNGMFISNRKIRSEVLQLKSSTDSIETNKLSDTMIMSKRLIPLDLQELFDENNVYIKNITSISNIDAICINIYDLYAKNLSKCKCLINAFLYNMKIHYKIPIIPQEVINLFVSFYFIDGDDIEVNITGSEINTQKAICLLEICVVNEIQKRLYLNQYY